MKPVTDILRDYRKGQLVEDASEALQEVVRSVLETGKPAEMAIGLELGDRCKKPVWTGKS